MASTAALQVQVHEAGGLQRQQAGTAFADLLSAMEALPEAYLLRLLSASTHTVQAQWSLSDMRYSLCSSHMCAFLKVIFTVLKDLSTTFSSFRQFGRMPGAAIVSCFFALHVHR